MGKILTVVAFLVFLTLSAQAKEDLHKKRHHKAHVHGSGKMNLAIDGNTLVVEFEFPAHDIIGFEHKPSTDKQKVKLASAIETLKSAASALELPRVSGCQPQGVAEVEAEMAEEPEKAKKKSEGHYHHHTEHDDENHSEIEVTYTYRCAQVEKIDSVKVLLFKNFKGMKKLKARGVTPRGQVSQTLTPASSRFDLGK